MVHLVLVGEDRGTANNPEPNSVDKARRLMPKVKRAEGRSLWLPPLGKNDIQSYFREGRLNKQAFSK